MTMHHSLPQWNYYQMLEADLEKSFRYIQPSPTQYSVTSDHFSMIILAAAAEIENALALVANHIACQPPPGNIHQYFTCVTGTYPNFCNTKISMPRFSGMFTPWQGWSASSAPDWWTNGYNKIKHDRLNYPDAPTLGRALNAMAALQALLLHYYKLIDPHATMPSALEPKLLQIVEPSTDFETGCIQWSWELPI